MKNRLTALLPLLASLVTLCLPPTAQAAGKDFATIEARPPHHVRPDATTAPAGYKPAQIRHAYGIDLLANGGAGQVIAIVDAYGSPTAQNDLNVFSSTFGLPQTTIQIVYGGQKPRKTDGGWALETSLDLQWAHSVAPNAKILLAVAPTAGLGDLLNAVRAAVNAGATVVSMSWGSSEFSSEANYDSYFQKTGVTFLASSGDNGAGASWPACSPSVVGVGGTTLYLDAQGNVTSPEVAWSGSGGGFSAYFARPAWQTGWQNSSTRAIPDVSMVADPNTGVSVYDSTSYSGQKGWFVVGGTSASAPMWAGVIALTNEQRLKAGKTALTGSDAALYALAGSVDASGIPQYSYYFFDVTTGSNGGFSAVPKYDEVTGLGTPIVPNVAISLGN